MEIYLLRHGIAENAGPGRPDSERALTEEGRDKLRRVLKRARPAEAPIALLLSSPLRRALETAEVASGVFEYRGKVVRTAALLPDASPRDTWNEIREHRGEPSLLLAGHEPLMSSLAAFLLGCPAFQVDFKKAGLMRIDIESFPPEPRGLLKWFLTPGVA